MEEEYRLVPVGWIRSPIGEPSEAPHQGRDTGVEVVVEVAPAYGDALDGIEEWDSLQIVCWLHRADREGLKVHPRGRRENPLRGVFATRSPTRPNPLALYTAEVVKVEGRRLTMRGIDAVDGTPVVDIRPHIHRLDD